MSGIRNSVLLDKVLVKESSYATSYKKGFIWSVVGDVLPVRCSRGEWENSSSETGFIEIRSWLLIGRELNVGGTTIIPPEGMNRSAVCRWKRIFQNLSEMTSYYLRSNWCLAEIKLLMKFLSNLLMKFFKWNKFVINFLFKAE